MIEKNNIKNMGIIVAVTIVVVYILMILFFPKTDHKTHTLPEEIPVDVEQQAKEEEVLPINIFFIATNKKGEEVYRAVRRNYSSADGTMLSFAISQLMSGPTTWEKNNGIYSEIPASTQVIGIIEQPDRFIINLSSDFETGGGTDSLYKRLYQLIKTVTRNSDLPVYLQIDGKQTDVIGGEGIILKQPLTGASLSE